MPPQVRQVEMPTSFGAQGKATTTTMDLRAPYGNQKIRSGDPSLGQQSEGASHKSSATPSSVYLGSSSVTRDLSDLSGSYANGTSSSRSNGRGKVPGHIYEPKSFSGPWRPAYILSVRAPSDCLSVSTCQGSKAKEATIVVDRHGVVEVVDREEDRIVEFVQEHHRVPLILLLMDPSRRIYEIMQLWVDRTTDTVRDVLHTVQQKLSDKWKQDYDGLFQVRGNKFSQLIHILGVEKYDIHPCEIWVAKPWSMTAKATIGFSTSLIRHLTSISVLSPTANEKTGFRLFRSKPDDSAITLSNDAQSRIYAPDGTLKHHHAAQFLSFSPPFDREGRNDELIDDSSASELPAGGESDAESLSKGSGSMAQRIATTRGITPSVTSTSEHQKVRTESRSNQILPFPAFYQNDQSSIISSGGQIFNISKPIRRRNYFSRLTSALNCSKQHRERAKEKAIQNKVARQSMSDASFHHEQCWSESRHSNGEDQSSVGHSVVSMSAPLLSCSGTGATKKQSYRQRNNGLRRIS